MWLGPPYMNRKMTLLAFGSKWGRFGASGLANALAPSAAVAWESKNAPSRRPESATEAKPPPACQRNSLRVLPQKSPVFRRIERFLRAGRPTGSGLWAGSVEVD